MPVYEQVFILALCSESLLVVLKEVYRGSKMGEEPRLPAWEASVLLALVSLQPQPSISLQEHEEQQGRDRLNPPLTQFVSGTQLGQHPPDHCSS